MRLEALLRRYAPAHPTVITVGTFDGVHTGHYRLLERIGELTTASLAAAGSPATGVAITFKQQPRAVIRLDPEITYLCNLDERIEMIREAGVDVVIPLDFDESVRGLEPDEFMRVLRDELDMRDFVAGPGATVGRNRKGDAHTLRRLSSELGFRLYEVSPACYQCQSVSSTAIRAALREGRLDDACGMLGRRYRLSGTVERGDRRGRDLGFPTANLSPGQPGMTLTVPGDGIYATWALLPSGMAYASATSIGLRPTFGGRSRVVESYLIDFEGDLYGQSMTLEFVAKLRDERKFDGREPLMDQMRRDTDQAREILNQRGRPIVDPS